MPTPLRRPVPRAASLLLAALAMCCSVVASAQPAATAAPRRSPLQPVLAELRAVDTIQTRVPSDFDIEHRALLTVQEQLAAFDRRAFSHDDSLDAEIIALQLRDRINELRFRGYLLPLGSRSGFHFNFAGLPESARFESVADYERYIARMRGFPAQVDEQIRLLREGIRTGMTMPRAVLEGYDRTAAMHVTDDPSMSAFARPFDRFPAAITEADRTRLRREGLAAVRDGAIAGFRTFAKFLAEEYIPAARRTLGADGLPDGSAYYAHRVRMYTTLDLTPAAVHRIGADLVTTIRKEMDAIRAEVGFAGDHAAFVDFLRTAPRFTVATDAAYLAHVSLAAKEMDGNLPRLFSRLPRTPYGIRAMPAHVAPRQSAGYYDRGDANGTRAGWVNINTSMLPSRPTWAARALAFHEGVPGHHLQIMLTQEREELSQVRRSAGVTVYVEGWGLYAEKLGLDVGLYADPYDRFGMWSYQIWRACRLVVDTGMHALGWTRERAIAYMAENTGMTVEAVTAEIDRHITEPGQGLAYTMGELEISALRKQAETRLGTRFDIRAVHEAVLKHGALPLPLLRREVTRWIDERAAERPFPTP
ncbi:MAG: DUF885 domain-containing protein [Gemmatimonadaceae bacterium]|nr:DUF885 domain-containing protein [Gemmatimonadaceae bacterium]